MFERALLTLYCCSRLRVVYYTIFLRKTPKFFSRFNGLMINGAFPPIHSSLSKISVFCGFNNITSVDSSRYFAAAIITILILWRYIVVYLGQTVDTDIGIIIENISDFNYRWKTCENSAVRVGLQFYNRRSIDIGYFHRFSPSVQSYCYNNNLPFDHFVLYAVDILLFFLYLTNHS